MFESVGTRRVNATGRAVVLALLAGAIAFALAACATLPGTDRADEAVPDVAPTEPPPEERAAMTEREVAEDVGIPAPPPDGAGPDAATVPPDERYLIRTLGIRLQVEEVESAVEQVRDAVDAVDGMVTAVQVSSEDIPIYRYEARDSLADGTPLKGYVTARIPPDQLDGFVEAVTDVGTVLRQAEDESDVTQEHLDISARLDNLRAQEERLRELFDRADEVEDMLAIERELARVRGDIESFEARLAFIERQAAMATVTVELVGRQPVVAPPGDDWGFVSAVRTGVRGLVQTINAIIVFSMSALPVVILALVAWGVIRTIVRVRRGRREQRGEHASAHDNTSG